MSFLRKAGKWVVIIYAAQALFGVAIGLYVGIAHPEKIERVMSCVAY